MKPKNRTALIQTEDWLEDSHLSLRRMERRLESRAGELPPEFAKMHTALAACQQAMGQLQSAAEAEFEADDILNRRQPEPPLTDGECRQLLALNRQLKVVTRHLRAVAEDVTPRLEAKLADPDDPMVDYEIEARIDYVLREDDPDYDQDDDNLLTSRDESLMLQRLALIESDDFAEPQLPAGLAAEPHCWLFHDLYDHDYGRQSPRLSFRNCLRIGRIHVDVQMWQQYDFNVPICDTN
jgi:hypothetical protein